VVRSSRDHVTQPGPRAGDGRDGRARRDRQRHLMDPRHGAGKLTARDLADRAGRRRQEADRRRTSLWSWRYRAYALEYGKVVRGESAAVSQIDEHVDAVTWQAGSALDEVRPAGVHEDPFRVQHAAAEAGDAH